ncbi:MAG: amidophosphoribosyltransferase [Dehalococcoidia bacterium]
MHPIPGNGPNSQADDRPREACGVVGAYLPGEDVSRIAFFGLFALQHRGQESAGIAATRGDRISVRAEMGLVAQVFREEDLEALSGHIAIGHTRYSTMGGSRECNAQPILAEGPHGQLALGHNGNVINASSLREDLAREWGSTFESTSDSEVIAEMYAKAPGTTWAQRSAHIMRRVRGAYSLVIMTKDELVAVRDPLGMRPLCLGSLNGGWVVASETCALDNIGAKFIRELDPGETLVINSEGLESKVWPGARKTHSMCVFEQIYFARPDSILGGELAYATRKRMGAQLFEQHPAEGDLVIGIPDSAIAAAVGYSQASDIPYGEGLVKNRYVGRTFIQPDQRMRDLGVQLKFNALPEMIAGKRLVIVDDSIVRGTTTPRVLKMLREAGATEIHMRVCAPPIIAPCHFGVDMGTIGELIAARKSVEEIRQYIDADTLGFLDVPGLMKAVGVKDDRYCRGCFTGEYPIPVQLEMNKLQMEAAGSR